MKRIMKKIKQNGWLFALMLSTMVVFNSCEEEDEGSGELSSNFEVSISEANYLEVTLTNLSENAVSYSWDFGDDMGTSEMADPVYAYAEEGTYEITLVASDAAGLNSSFSQEVIITNPNGGLTILLGEWQLLADGSTGINTYEVGPSDGSGTIWFGYGAGGNEFDELCVRACTLDDTWTFNEDGTYTFDNHGDYFAGGNVWTMDYECFDATVDENFVGTGGEDLSAWNSGTHGYSFNASAKTLTVTGGFIGLPNVGSTDGTDVPLESVTYKVIDLIEGDVDTLFLETTFPDGYWAFTLVKYNDPADKVIVDDCPQGIDDINIDFESNPPTWTPFGGPGSDGNGVTPSTVANPVSGGINTSAMVGQLDEADGSQGWTGISTDLEGKIDFSTKQTFKVKVYSPFAGAVIKFKLESIADPNNNKEIDVATTNADTWEELSFVFETGDSNKWDRLVLFFDFKGDAKAGARTHYFDDIILE